MATHVNDTDLIFAITADSGTFAKQAKWLCRSIFNHHPDTRIVVFIPTSGYQEMDDQYLSYFQDNCIVETGEYPIQEDPMSALTRSFIIASRLATDEFVIQMDTDMLLLNPIILPNDDGDVYVKPEDTGAQYWGSAEEEWRELYQYFDLEFPSKCINATVDERPIPPLWNGGIVITKDYSLAERWLSISKEIRKSYDFLSKNSKNNFNEQISLSIALCENDIIHLPEKLNYNLECYFQCPDDVIILHYHKIPLLSMVNNTLIRKKLENLEIERANPSTFKKFKRFFWVLYYQSGTYLSYRRKENIRKFLYTILIYTRKITGGWPRP